MPPKELDVGLVKRLKRITPARVSAFLDSVDHPESVLPVLMSELEQQVSLAVRAESKAHTAMVAASSRVDSVEAYIGRLQRGAELAVRQGDEDTAKEFLAEQARMEEKAGDDRLMLKLARKAFAEAGEAREQLLSIIRDLRTRAGDSGMLDLMPDDDEVGPCICERSILDAVLREDGMMSAPDYVGGGLADRLSAKVDSVEVRLKDLEREVMIEERMDALRCRLMVGGKKMR